MAALLIFRITSGSLHETRVTASAMTSASTPQCEHENCYAVIRRDPNRVRDGGNICLVTRKPHRLSAY
jgi:hypothetical protein